MFFNFSDKSDINNGVKEWENTHGAVLLDVRTKEEYMDYHIEGSINIPLDNLSAVHQSIKDKSTPIFVHCLSGARSASAAEYLKAHNYNNVKNIGGINAYNGEVI